MIQSRRQTALLRSFGEGKNRRKKKQCRQWEVSRQNAVNQCAHFCWRVLVVPSCNTGGNVLWAKLNEGSSAVSLSSICDEVIENEIYYWPQFLKGVISLFNDNSLPTVQHNADTKCLHTKCSGRTKQYYNCSILRFQNIRSQNKHLSVILKITRSGENCFPGSISIVEIDVLWSASNFFLRLRALLLISTSLLLMLSGFVRSGDDRLFRDFVKLW